MGVERGEYMAWEIPIASDFYQLPSAIGGSFNPQSISGSSSKAMTMLAGALG